MEARSNVRSLCYVTRCLLHMIERIKARRVTEVIPFHWESPKWTINWNCSAQIVVRNITATIKSHKKTASKTVNTKQIILETTLYSDFKIFTSNSPKIRTYKTLRSERPTSFLGIDPVSLLLLSRLRINLIIFNTN